MNPHPTRIDPAVALPKWLAYAAALAVVGLLLAFYQVVRESVARGESMRKATAVHGDGTWRCNALRGRDLRADCLIQLDGPRDTGGAQQQTLPIATLARLDN